MDESVALNGLLTELFPMLFRDFFFKTTIQFSGLFFELQGRSSGIVKYVRVAFESQVF